MQNIGLPRIWLVHTVFILVPAPPGVKLCLAFHEMPEALTRVTYILNQ